MSRETELLTSDFSRLISRLTLPLRPGGFDSYPGEIGLGEIELDSLIPYHHVSRAGEIDPGEIGGKMSDKAQIVLVQLGHTLWLCVLTLIMAGVIHR